MGSLLDFTLIEPGDKIYVGNAQLTKVQTGLAKWVPSSVQGSGPLTNVMNLYIVEEACQAGLHYSGFSCGNHQPKIFFEIPDISAACCCLHQW